MQNNFDHKFRPRGIDKWHAFAALVSGDEQKESAIEKTVLSFDFFDEYYDDLDLLIKEAIANKQRVKVTYLIDNKYQEVIGLINKVDEYNKTLVIDKKTIPFVNIFTIEPL